MVLTVQLLQTLILLRHQSTPHPATTPTSETTGATAANSTSEVTLEATRAPNETPMNNDG